MNWESLFISFIFNLTQFGNKEIMKQLTRNNTISKFEKIKLN